MWDGNERREHKRYGVKNSTVRYLKAGVLAFLSNYSERYLLLNVCEGGVHFITREQLAEGTVLKLQLGFPEIDSPLKTKGVVVWSTKSKEHDAFRTGVRMTSISQKALRQLRFVLDNTLLDNVKVTTGIYLREIERL